MNDRSTPDSRAASVSGVVNAPTPLPAPSAPVRLLALVARRRTAEVGLLLLPPLLVVLHSVLTQARSPLWLWAVAMAALALGLIGLRLSFRHTPWADDGAAWVRRWQRRIVLGAGLAGLAWSAPTWGLRLLGPAPPLAWSTTFYIALCGVTTGAAVYLPAVRSAFTVYALGIWLPAALATPWMFGSAWPVVLAFSLLFLLVSLQHGRGTHGFLLQQIRLEDESQQLSQRFRQAKERAEAAVREKNRFLATASHDLRQPVHAMGLLAHAIAQRNRDPALEPLLHDLRHGLGSLNLMFNALLDLSRSEAATAPAPRLNVALAPLVQEVAVLFREQALQRGLRLRVHLPRNTSAPVVLADPALLRQALVNLVHNALRYTLRGGVLVGVRARGGSWQIEVVDTGPGIGATEQSHIFEPYYRGATPPAESTDAAGHGLGLAVVARCARIMDGTLALRSRPGHGSRFCLRLPKPAAAFDGVLHWPDASANPSAPRLQLNGRCLVLDDEPQVRGAWGAVLGSWGLEARCVGDEAEALRLIDAGFLPAVIFCDQRLGTGRSGFAVLRNLLARCPEASGAMVSGELDSPELAQAEDEGYTVLRKPLDPAALQAVLQAWLGGR